MLDSYAVAASNCFKLLRIVTCVVSLAGNEPEAFDVAQQIPYKI